MSSLEEAIAPTGGVTSLVTRLSRRLGAVSRRGFLVRTAVAGSALAVDPRTYALQPVTAYATICGPGNTAASGWTVFCCTINNGVNACPPGSFAAGWWKSADSSWCCGGYRYIVDCNASCTRCSSGCTGDHICDSRCWNCSCGSGSTATCDQRRVCCNAFRYGQCNTQVSCSGGVHCRVVSCVPPYQWTNCTTTSLSDDRTSEHGAPCLQGCGAILSKYGALGANGSFLKASLGPERAVGDGRGRYVAYQGGYIYWTSSTGAWSVHSWPLTQWNAVGGARGVLGYPRSDMSNTKDGKGWIQVFEHGAITDSTMTTMQYVYDPAWPLWSSSGRESGSLGYPSSGRVASTVVRGSWSQTFQRGAIASSTAGTFVVDGYPYPWWTKVGGQDGVLRSPTTAVAPTKDGKGWIQTFQGGCITDSTMTFTQYVLGAAWPLWQESGRETGPLGYPTTGQVASTATSGSWSQSFQRGAIASSTAGTFVVDGYPYPWWTKVGGQDGVLRSPTAAVAPTKDGKGWIQTFQGGCITDSTMTFTQYVLGRMFEAWAAAGRESGVLGYPTGGQAAPDNRGTSQPFQGGGLWELTGKPAYAVHGRVLAQWQASGGPGGSYGYPLSNTVPNGDGRDTCTFEHGTITA